MKIMNIIAFIPLIWLLTFCTPNNNQSKSNDNGIVSYNDINDTTNDDVHKTYEIAVSNSENSNKPTGKVEYLTTEDFINKVFDYRNNKSWSYKGKVHCVIDFYADWCGPCKRVAPIMDQLAQEYSKDIQFYKVNTDNEQELAQAFGIKSIPTILICPLNGDPVMSVGAYPKEEYQKMISQVIYKQ
jgi:thioredoxin 1